MCRFAIGFAEVDLDYCYGDNDPEVTGNLKIEIIDIISNDILDAIPLHSQFSDGRCKWLPRLLDRFSGASSMSELKKSFLGVNILFDSIEIPVS